ncbi:LysR family transcriptional regulator [Leifsonia sp. Root4]|uniref:LysR family transcriptional regulator n=1 Tax=Leifsonia sp. Root4 TaxID=1736525 RepID=UPI0006FDAE41|nr:LysR family transcriptional regulator [Leifsonia sp. Root4]KQW05092.1 LysR family transcriptional regulator [Leifsonia sp. Root4]
MRETHNLEHLRTFVTVYRAGSLTEAAHLLGVSQATVSTHIQSLEATFGFPLFTRGRTGVTATARATELVSELATHIDALDDIAALSATNAARPAALHIGGPAELLGTMVIPRLGELRESVGVPLWFTFGLAEELLESLRTGALDVVVSAVAPQLSGLGSTPLYDEEFLLVAAPVWADAPSEDWSQIPVIAYAGNLPIIRRYWRSVFGRRPEDVTLAAVVPDLRGIRSALLAGAGMSVLPHYLVAEDLASGALVQLHTPEIAPLNTVYLAVRNGEAARSPRLRALLGELSRVIR